jgi:RNA binding exosome subunit
VAERIQHKITSETNLLSAIADSVKELRHLQIQTDTQDATLRQTELTVGDDLALLR